MKRLRKCFCALILLLSVSVFAYSQSSQVMVPKEVFVGDDARIQYKFESQIDFFALADESLVSDGVIFLKREVLSEISELCTVKEARLSHEANGYLLVLTIVPWQPGEIVFKQFDLYRACGWKNTLASGFYVNLEPVVISSLVKKMNVSSLRPQMGPLLLPGTNYILLAFVVLLVLLAIAVFIVIVRLKKIISMCHKMKLSAGLRKNAKVTRKKIRVLEKKCRTDAEFACEWQHIMRQYLEYRFDVKLASVTSQKIFSEVSSRSGCLLDEAYENVLTEISSLFVRTDYIRYARGSLDSFLLPQKEHQAAFLNGEKKQIVTSSLSYIDSLELRGPYDKV